MVAVEYAAFQGCFALTTVEMPGCVAFGVRLFSECCALEQEIQAEAFTGCLALASIDLPDKLRYIAHRAFGECGLLSHLHYRRMVRATWRRPYAAHNAFESCFRLAPLVAQLSPAQWGRLDGAAKLSYLTGPTSIG